MFSVHAKCAKESQLQKNEADIREYWIRTCGLKKIKIKIGTPNTSTNSLSLYISPNQPSLLQKKGKNNKQKQNQGNGTKDATLFVEMVHTQQWLASSTASSSGTRASSMLTIKWRKPHLPALPTIAFHNLKFDKARNTYTS